MHRKGLLVIPKVAALAALLMFLCAFGSSRTAAAAEVRIPPLKAAPGQQVQVPIVVDHIDNLAGLKIVLEYDKTHLTYQSTAKAKEAASLIHIVNDKKPGLLIAVMAGAQGINADRLAILTVTFTVAAGAPAGTSLAVTISESQLMSDKLKDIAHQVKTVPIEIVETQKTE